MNIKEALTIIGSTTFKDMNDITYHYKKELQKASTSHENAFNNAIKQEYAKKIEDLNAAYAYVNENKKELKKHNSLEMPTVSLTKKQKKMAIFIGVLGLLLISFFTVRSYMADNFLHEGKGLYQEKNYEEALKAFEKSYNYGSIEGRYFYGKTLYFMNPEYRTRGFNIMKEAVDGFAVLDQIEQRIFNKLLTKTKVLNKND